MNYTYLDCLAMFGVGGAHPGGLRLTKNILSSLDLDETKTVLDVGCGTGQTSAYIAENYRCKVISLDSNQIMLEKATKRFSERQLPIEVKHGRTENLPLDENFVDVVLSESVTAFTDIPLTIQEYKRVLKQGGVFIAVEMVLETPLPKEDVKSVIDFYGVHQLLTEQEWYDLLQNAGYKQIEIEKVKTEFDKNDVDNAADFSLSENIDGGLYEILAEHERLTKTFQDILGFRVFKGYIS
ncbi:class I SAM-dependent methyltransferase [Virgibacillus oceani]|uniref:Methyltransferase n=1 Tax=Virgibacillus oceani TaxID=1479511 RepID=A0A917HRG0_9BACI|nr:class I SAM-dependent methyltransferase [Virgibacillus oceani]GGG87161.1 methyltransferase [Virgibacillus oceani]